MPDQADPARDPVPSWVAPTVGQAPVQGLAGAARVVQIIFGGLAAVWAALLVFMTFLSLLADGHPQLFPRLAAAATLAALSAGGLFVLSTRPVRVVWRLLSTSAVVTVNVGVFLLIVSLSH